MYTNKIKVKLIWYYGRALLHENLGLVVQSIVSLMSSLVVKMLGVLVSRMSNSQLFLLKKCE